MKALFRICCSELASQTIWAGRGGGTPNLTSVLDNTARILNQNKPLESREDIKSEYCVTFLSPKGIKLQFIKIYERFIRVL